MKFTKSFVANLILRLFPRRTLLSIKWRTTKIVLINFLCLSNHISHQCSNFSHFVHKVLIDFFLFGTITSTLKLQRSSTSIVKWKTISKRKLRKNKKQPKQKFPVDQSRYFCAMKVRWTPIFTHTNCKLARLFLLFACSDDRATQSFREMPFARDGWRRSEQEQKKNLISPARTIKSKSDRGNIRIDWARENGSLSTNICEHFSFFFCFIQQTKIPRTTITLLHHFRLLFSLFLRLSSNASQGVGGEGKERSSSCNFQRD